MTGILINIQSCDDDLVKNTNRGDLLPKLSEYAIFQGNPADLISNDEYKLYELSSQLFTDYAEKQRLIKVPQGSRLSAIDNALLDFPEGTTLVKTFFYYHDKGDLSKGKHLIETRLLIKLNTTWIAGTYVWNDNQTEATLVTSGLNKTINWIDAEGNGNVISYRIPSKTECATCHNSNNSIIPIGPKARALNYKVQRDNSLQNQLAYLSNAGILNPVSHTSFGSLPNYNDSTFSLEERARAYLEMNCAHCHSDNGFASDQRLRLDYGKDLHESNLMSMKDNIIRKMESGEMPKIGTTLIDKEGLELIKNFIDSLKTHRQ